MPSKDEPSKNGNFDFCRGEEEEEKEKKKTSREGRRRWGRWRRRRDSTGVCDFAANGVPVPQNSYINTVKVQRYWQEGIVRQLLLAWETGG